MSLEDLANNQLHRFWAANSERFDGEGACLCMVVSIDQTQQLAFGFDFDDFERETLFGLLFLRWHLLVGILRQESRFVSQPITNDASTLVRITWPILREGMVGDFVRLNTECDTDDHGSMVAIVIIYGLLKEVGITHRIPGICA